MPQKLIITERDGALDWKDVVITSNGQSCTAQEVFDGFNKLIAERDQLQRANTELHKAIEEFWVKQRGEHACGCDAWPECTHTFNAAMLRKAAMALDEPAETK